MSKKTSVCLHHSVYWNDTPILPPPQSAGSTFFVGFLLVPYFPMSRYNGRFSEEQATVNREISLVKHELFLPFRPALRLSASVGSSGGRGVVVNCKRCAATETDYVCGNRTAWSHPSPHAPQTHTCTHTLSTTHLRLAGHLPAALAPAPPPPLLSHSDLGESITSWRHHRLWHTVLLSSGGVRVGVHVSVRQSKIRLTGPNKDGCRGGGGCFLVDEPVTAGPLTIFQTKCMFVTHFFKTTVGF